MVGVALGSGVCVGVKVGAGVKVGGVVGVRVTVGELVGTAVGRTVGAAHPVKRIAKIRQYARLYFFIRESLIKYINRLDEMILHAILNQTTKIDDGNL